MNNYFTVYLGNTSFLLRQNPDLTKATQDLIFTNDQFKTLQRDVRALLLNVYNEELNDADDSKQNYYEYVKYICFYSSKKKKSV